MGFSQSSPPEQLFLRRQRLCFWQFLSQVQRSACQWYVYPVLEPASISVLARFRKPTYPVGITERLFSLLPDTNNSCYPVVRRIVKSKFSEKFHESLGISYSTALSDFRYHISPFVSDARMYSTHSIRIGGANDLGSGLLTLCWFTDMQVGGILNLSFGIMRLFLRILLRSLALCISSCQGHPGLQSFVQFLTEPSRLGSAVHRAGIIPRCFFSGRVRVFSSYGCSSVLPQFLFSLAYFLLSALIPCGFSVRCLPHCILLHYCLEPSFSFARAETPNAWGLFRVLLLQLCLHSLSCLFFCY